MTAVNSTASYPPQKKGCRLENFELASFYLKRIKREHRNVGHKEMADSFFSPLLCAFGTNVPAGNYPGSGLQGFNPRVLLVTAADDHPGLCFSNIGVFLCAFPFVLHPGAFHGCLGHGIKCRRSYLLEILTGQRGVNQ